jgi:hypothetical protein
MKLHELKQATRNLHLVDLDHVNEIGKIAYRMGINREACMEKSVQAREVWQRGWDHARRSWEALLKKDGADGFKIKLWGI